MTSGSILLVDDERDFVDALADRLSVRGFETDVVYDGESAVEKVKQHSYDAIILDVVMPGMDGFETLKCVLAIDPDVQVILLTAHGTLRVGVDAVKKGAADFVSKPPEFGDLLDRVQEAATKKMLLVEKRHEEEVSDILRRKGW